MALIDEIVAIVEERSQRVLPFASIPKEMRNPASLTMDGQCEWRFVKGKPAGAAFEALEREAGFAYPSLYKEMWGAYHWLDLDFGFVRFPPNPPGGALEDLRQLVFKTWNPERIVGSGLLPFGEEGWMHTGPMCFDTQQAGPGGDCPVVYWDHDRVDQEGEVGPTVFSSFGKLLEGTLFVLRQRVKFLRHDPFTDAGEVRREKLGLLEQFYALDPDGAGGDGRRYWDLFASPR